MSVLLEHKQFKSTEVAVHLKIFKILTNQITSTIKKQHAITINRNETSYKANNCIQYESSNKSMESFTTKRTTFGPSDTILLTG